MHCLSFLFFSLSGVSETVSSYNWQSSRVGTGWNVTFDSCSPRSCQVLGSCEAVCVWTEESTCSADWQSSLLRGSATLGLQPRCTTVGVSEWGSEREGARPFDPWWEIVKRLVMHRLGLGGSFVLMSLFLLWLYCTLFYLVPLKIHISSHIVLIQRHYTLVLLGALLQQIK